MSSPNTSDSNTDSDEEDVLLMGSLANEDRPFDLLDLVIAAGQDHASRRCVDPIPCRTSALTGAAYCHEVLNGSPVRFRQVCRMTKPTFDHILSLLKPHLGPSRLQPEERFMMFLFTVGNAASNRTTQERWQHSGSTVSNYFGEIIDALVAIAPDHIRMPREDSPTHPRIASDQKYAPYFGNCIGAIDGTHIPASVSVTEDDTDQAAYRNRKGWLSQNVLAGCDFDMKFIFVMAGVEGSAGDGAVLAMALQDLDFVVPKGKVLLVDAGYANEFDFLSPFRGVRYHLKEWGLAHERPQTPEELFNLRHSALRNVIERIYGVIKERFPILVHMPTYSLKVQRDLVIALCCLHNLIRTCGSDWYDDEAERQRRTQGEQSVAEVPDEFVSYTAATDAERREADREREELARQMWEDYQEYMRRAGV